MLQKFWDIFSGKMPMDSVYSRLVRLIDMSLRNGLAFIWGAINLVGTAASNGWERKLNFRFNGEVCGDAL
jgi:hypothetical protein